MSMDLLIVLFPVSYIYELFEMSDYIIHECPTCPIGSDKALLIITNRCLLVKTLKMFRIPCVLQDFSLFCLEFVIAWSDDSGYYVRTFPVGA